MGVLSVPRGIFPSFPTQNTARPTPCRRVPSVPLKTFQGPRIKGVINDERAKIGVAWTTESYPKLVCKLLLRRIKKFIEIFLLQCA